MAHGLKIRALLQIYGDSTDFLMLKIVHLAYWLEKKSSVLKKKKCSEQSICSNPSEPLDRHIYSLNEKEPLNDTKQKKIKLIAFG